MKTKVKVEGLRQLDAALGQMKESTAKGVLRRVGRAALDPIDADWRRRAPHLWGDLQDSGGVGSNLSKAQRKAHVRESTVEVFAGPGPNPQAVQQEFGNRDQAAQPFLRPAWEAGKLQVLEDVKSGLAEEIDKTAARAARRGGKAKG